MLTNKKGRHGGNRSAHTYSSSQNSSIAQRPCTCFQGGARASACIVCLAWARLYRRLQAMRQAVTV